MLRTSPGDIYFYFSILEFSSEHKDTILISIISPGTFQRRTRSHQSSHLLRKNLNSHCESCVANTSAGTSFLRTAKKEEGEGRREKKKGKEELEGGRARQRRRKLRVSQVVLHSLYPFLIFLLYFIANIASPSSFLSSILRCKLNCVDFCLTSLLNLRDN